MRLWKGKIVMRKLFCIFVALCLFLSIFSTSLADSVRYVKVFEEPVKSTYALRDDGKIDSWGAVRLPGVASWTDIIDFSIGPFHALGLKKNGTVIATGSNDNFECDVQEWKDIIKVCAGAKVSLGLTSNGTVVATGDYRTGVTEAENWTDIIDISTGYGNLSSAHAFALTKDGRILHAGDELLSGKDECLKWTDIVAMAVGFSHIVGLKSDGTVVAAGSDSEYQCNVGKWKDIKKIVAGNNTTYGQKSDGTWIYTGKDYYNYVSNITDWSNIIDISNSDWDVVALLNDGSLIGFGANEEGEINFDNTNPPDITADACFKEIASYLKNPSSASLNNSIAASVNGTNYKIFLLDITAENGYGGKSTESFFVVCDTSNKQYSAISFDGIVSHANDLKEANKVGGVVLKLNLGENVPFVTNQLSMSKSEFADYLNAFYETYYN